MPSVTWTVCSEPSREYVIEALSPGFMAPITLWSSSEVETAFPSTAVMTSPPVGNSWPPTTVVASAALRPASAAGPPRGHLRDLHAGRQAELGGQGIGDRGDADAEVGVLDLAGGDELGDHRLDRVRRDGEADAVVPAGVALDLRVDADHLALRDPGAGRRSCRG